MVNNDKTWPGGWWSDSNCWQGSVVIVLMMVISWQRSASFDTYYQMLIVRWIDTEHSDMPQLPNKMISIRGKAQAIDGHRWPWGHCLDVYSFGGINNWSMEPRWSYICASCASCGSKWLLLRNLQLGWGGVLSAHVTAWTKPCLRSLLAGSRHWFKAPWTFSYRWGSLSSRSIYTNSPVAHVWIQKMKCTLC